MWNAEITYQVAMMDNRARITAAAVARETRAARTARDPWWRRRTQRRQTLAEVRTFVTPPCESTLASAR